MAGAAQGDRSFRVARRDLAESKPSELGRLPGLDRENGPLLGVVPIPAHVYTPADIDNVFDALAREPNGGLLVLPDTFTTVHRDKIVALADHHRLPAVYPLRFFATSGGLMAYGADLVELLRLSALYVDRILRGAHPSDLPVQSSTRFELIINLKTAKALGLEVPPTLLARADEVIE